MKHKRITGVCLMAAGSVVFAVSAYRSASASNRQASDSAQESEEVVGQPAQMAPESPPTTAGIPEADAARYRDAAIASTMAKDLLGDALSTARVDEDVAPWFSDDGQIFGYGVTLELAKPIDLSESAAKAANLPGQYSSVTGVIVFVGPEGDTLQITVVDGVLDPRVAESLEPLRPGALPE